MRNVLKGALAGAVATLFHTATMYALRRRRRPLPPVAITDNAVRRTGIDTRVGTPTSGATAVLHFGFGALAGALYAPLGRRNANIFVGILYGIGVWAISYLGWIPAMRLYPPATRQRPEQNRMMIAAHIAWGVALAAVFRGLSRKPALKRRARFG